MARNSKLPGKKTSVPIRGKLEANMMQPNSIEYVAGHRVKPNGHEMFRTVKHI